MKEVMKWTWLPILASGLTTLIYFFPHEGSVALLILSGLFLLAVFAILGKVIAECADRNA